MDKLEFKTSYNCRKESEGITFTEPSRTKQSMKDECDINLILKRYQATGVISHVSSLQPVFADVSNFGDYQQCLEYVRQAEEAFNALPSDVRSRLDNNPENLVHFIQDPNNRDECIRLGIFNKPAEAVEPRVVVPAGSVSAETPTN